MEVCRATHQPQPSTTIEKKQPCSSSGLSLFLTMDIRSDDGGLKCWTWEKGALLGQAAQPECEMLSGALENDPHVFS